MLRITLTFLTSWFALHSSACTTGQGPKFSGVPRERRALKSTHEVRLVVCCAPVQALVGTTTSVNLASALACHLLGSSCTVPCSTNLVGLGAVTLRCFRKDDFLKKTKTKKQKQKKHTHSNSNTVPYGNRS